MKQLKVSLEDHDYASLEAESDLTGRSMSEIVRTRFQERSRRVQMPDTLEMLDAVSRLINLVEQQTKRSWSGHPAAIRVLQDAIVARLERLRGGVKDAEFTWDEIPREDRVVALAGAADQRLWGPALEAIDFRDNPNWNFDNGVLMPPV